MDVHTAPTTARVAPDAIVRVVHGGEGHLVVVRCSLASHLIVSPLHPYTEWATGSDVIVEPDAGRRWPVVVHLGMEGCVEHADIDAVVGQLGRDWALGARGTRLMGPLDARWEFVDRQRAWFAQLCAPCTARLLEELDAR